MDLLLHLQALSAVIDQRSFTRAAGVLGVPQPVVSRRVAALERHLGGRLVVRDPRGVVPNELGRLVLPYAEDLAVRAEHLVSAARAAGSDVVLWLPDGIGARALVSARGAAQALGLRLRYEVADPEARAARVGGATAGLALLPCPADEADMSVRLGAGTRDAPRRRLHLDALRGGRASEAPVRRLHLGAEDDRPWVRDVVVRSAARAGLGPHQVTVGSAPLTAVGDVLEHDDVWLCTPAEAGAHGLGWAEVADLRLRRHYRLVTSRAGAAAITSQVRAALAVELAGALDTTDEART